MNTRGVLLILQKKNEVSECYEPQLRRKEFIVALDVIHISVINLLGRSSVLPFHILSMAN